MLRLLLGQWMAQLMSRTYTFLDPAILSGGRGQVVALRGRSGSERVPMPDARLFFEKQYRASGGWDGCHVIFLSSHVPPSLCCLDYTPGVRVLRPRDGPHAE
ncbi:MAG: hypothetical protein PVI68_16460 [Anaerolineae bacterium]